MQGSAALRKDTHTNEAFADLDSGLRFGKQFAINMQYNARRYMMNTIALEASQVFSSAPPIALYQGSQMLLPLRAVSARPTKMRLASLIQIDREDARERTPAILETHFQVAHFESTHGIPTTR